MNKFKESFLNSIKVEDNEDEILLLQRKLEDGLIDEGKLSNEEIVEMKNLYCNQISDLIESIKSYKLKILKEKENKMKVILASASPRRKELLNLIIPEFDIIVSDKDEKLEEGLEPQEQATRLAYIKAKDVYEKTKGNRIIIGSDTIVTKNGKIYGKPKDEDHAKQMIKELLQGNKVHSIITGLCLIIEKEGEYQEFKTFDEVKVYFKDISDEEIDKWIATGNAMDKARGVWNTK